MIRQKQGWTCAWGEGIYGKDKGEEKRQGNDKSLAFSNVTSKEKTLLKK